MKPLFRKSKNLRRLVMAIFLIFLVGMIIPQGMKMPVDGASSKDYHPESFWYYPWGKSGTHKGVDIFAVEGKGVKASTNGLVIFSGYNGRGGNAILILGPKWRLHYFAHLKEKGADAFSFCRRGSKIGRVGTTGNAKGKAPHLHYSIISLVPYPWKIDFSPQGWKKAFFLNPIAYLEE